MVIPTKLEIKKDIKTIKQKCKKAGLEVQKVILEVLPYQMQDLWYEYQKDTKTLKLVVYSVYYPNTLYDWIDKTIEEIKRGG